MNLNYTLIGQMVFFLVFVAFCMKYVWPPIFAAMQEREKKIAGGLEAADQAARDLALAKERAAEQLKEAKGQAADIIEQARKRSDQVVEEAKNQAREEGERIKAAAQSDIVQETNRAREELRGKLAALAVAGAEKILGASVDQGAHSAMLDKLASEL